jgi:hypothetical protein
MIKQIKNLIIRIINKLLGIVGLLIIDKDQIIVPIDTRQLIINDITYLNYATIDSPPPNDIPSQYYNLFTMDGRIPVIYKYFDDRKNISYLLDENAQEAKSFVVNNTKEKYSDVLMQIKNKQLNYYGKEAYTFYDALKKYDLAGKSVIIWGLADCNCDAMAIYYNAEKVYVVDYNKPICEHEKIEVLTFDEMKARDIKADVAFSYSSFEHDGLGRYGDPINPDGDILAMQEARNRLKESGLLFFGVPLGSDCLCWNAHRIYGAIRLPLILKGFHCIDVYNAYTPANSEKYPFDIRNGGYIQCLMILKKISKDYPEDSDLIQKCDTQKENTSAPYILDNINKAIIEYKNTKKK